jgi:hypothetical protein
MKALSKDPEDKLEVMKWTEALYNALEIFEPLRHDHAHIARLLQACLWPTNVFSREAMIGAWECGFKHFSQHTLEDLAAVARSHAVKSIEDLHRNLNVQARQNYNGKLSRHDRWHVAQTCGVMEDMDRKTCVPTTEEKRMAAKESLTNKSYIPNAKEFSMGEDVYKDLLSTKECL